MTIDRDLIQRMAKELDRYRQIVLDDCTSTHPFADEARAYLDKPEPEGPTDEELVAVLKQAIKDFPPNHPDAKALDSLEYDIEIELRKARAVIAADRARCGRPAVKPVPVSERMPGEGDCDSEGRCWLASVDVEPGWVTDNPEQCTNWTHWLPHYALPVPTPTETIS